MLTTKNRIAHTILIMQGLISIYFDKLRLVTQQIKTLKSVNWKPAPSYNIDSCKL